MRPLTKIFLVLALVAVAAGALVLTSYDWKAPVTTGEKATPKVADAPPRETGPVYDDRISAYERWRDRLTPPADQGTSPQRPVPGPRDLVSTSRTEGTVVAHRLETPVAGADPPGPILRPDGVAGEIVTEPLRSRRTDPGKSHTVVSGDTLYGIAMQYYGDPKYVDAIAAANPGLDPRALHIGDRVILPDPEKEKEKTQGASAPPAEKPVKVYVVKKNDTLIGIARRIYGDAAMYPRIYEANKDVLSSLNARLYVGQRLRLPEP